MESEFRRPEIASLKRARNNNKIEYCSADELSTGLEDQRLFKSKLSSSCRVEKASEVPALFFEESPQSECTSLPPIIINTPVVAEQNGIDQVRKKISISQTNFNYIH